MKGGVIRLASAGWRAKIKAAPQTIAILRPANKELMSMVPGGDSETIRIGRPGQGAVVDCVRRGVEGLGHAASIDQYSHGLC